MSSNSNDKEKFDEICKYWSNDVEEKTGARQKSASIFNGPIASSAFSISTTRLVCIACKHAYPDNFRKGKPRWDINTRKAFDIGRWKEHCITAYHCHAVSNYENRDPEKTNTTTKQTSLWQAYKIPTPTIKIPADSCIISPRPKKKRPSDSQIISVPPNRSPISSSSASTSLKKSKSNSKCQGILTTPARRESSTQINFSIVVQYYELSKDSDKMISNKSGLWSYHSNNCTMDDVDPRTFHIRNKRSICDSCWAMLKMKSMDTFWSKAKKGLEKKATTIKRVRGLLSRDVNDTSMLSRKAAVKDLINFTKTQPMYFTKAGIELKHNALFRISYEKSRIKLNTPQESDNDFVATCAISE